jgi:hypothetical protein
MKSKDSDFEENYELFHQSNKTDHQLGQIGGSIIKEKHEHIVTNSASAANRINKFN